MSFFRYPGGKTKLRNQIIAKLAGIIDPEYEYREPFFGGGSIGLSLVHQLKIKNVWVNDKDYGISCLWTSVISFPDLLKKFVLNFKPSIEAFDDFKSELLADKPSLLNGESIAEYGFKKLAIHQISYSGLGTKSGGPLGGKKQESKYKIDCRWSPQYICKKIDKLHDQFSNLNIRYGHCTNFDFSSLINDEQSQAVLYLDPPYYVKGSELYQHGFDQGDHDRLASLLKMTKHQWVLSYDDCENIRDLYNWAKVDTIDVNYTITALKDKKTGDRFGRKKLELLIGKL